MAAASRSGAGGAARTRTAAHDASAMTGVSASGGAANSEMVASLAASAVKSGCGEAMKQRFAHSAANVTLAAAPKAAAAASWRASGASIRASHHGRARGAALRGVAACSVE